MRRGVVDGCRRNLRRQPDRTEEGRNAASAVDASGEGDDLAHIESWRCGESESVARLDVAQLLHFRWSRGARQSGADRTETIRQEASGGDTALLGNLRGGSDTEGAADCLALSEERREQGADGHLYGYADGNRTGGERAPIDGRGDTAFTYGQRSAGAGAEDQVGTGARCAACVFARAGKERRRDTHQRRRSAEVATVDQDGVLGRVGAALAVQAAFSSAASSAGAVGSAPGAGGGCCFLSAWRAEALRRRISWGEYMVPRHFVAPQLHLASSSPPS